MSKSNVGQKGYAHMGTTATTTSGRKVCRNRPRAGEVAVQISYYGICGTDQHETLQCPCS